MDIDNLNHLATLKKALSDRLRMLELQAATYGLSSPPEIQVEIKQIRAAIEEIDIKLSSAQRDVTQDREQAKTILVVDDDDTIRELINDILTPEGYILILAKNGLDALRVIKPNKQIDLILSDMHMPSMTGYDLLLMLRERKVSARFVLMTGSSESGDNLFRVCMQMGATDYLEKPFNIERLLYVVKKSLEIDPTLDKILQDKSLAIESFLVKIAELMKENRRLAQENRRLAQDNLRLSQENTQSKNVAD